jgi:hypothetical protein
VKLEAFVVNTLTEMDGAAIAINTQRFAEVAKLSGVDVTYKQALTFLPNWARGVQVFVRRMMDLNGEYRVHRHVAIFGNLTNLNDALVDLEIAGHARARAVAAAATVGRDLDFRRPRHVLSLRDSARPEAASEEIAYKAASPCAAVRRRAKTAWVGMPAFRHQSRS